MKNQLHEHASDAIKLEGYSQLQPIQLEACLKMPARRVATAPRC